MVSFPLSALCISLIITTPLFSHCVMRTFLFCLSSCPFISLFPLIFPSYLILAFCLNHKTRPSKQTLNLKLDKILFYVSTTLTDFSGEYLISSTKKIWSFKCKMLPAFLCIWQTSSGLCASVNHQLGFCFHFRPWKSSPCAVIPAGLVKNADMPMQGKNLFISNILAHLQA